MRECPGGVIGVCPGNVVGILLHLVTEIIITKKKPSVV